MLLGAQLIHMMLLLRTPLLGLTKGPFPLQFQNQLPSTIAPTKPTSRGLCWPILSLSPDVQFRETPSNRISFEIKQELVDATIKSPHRRLKGKSTKRAPSALPPKYASVLRHLCKGHSVYPSLESRQQWAKINGLWPGDVHMAIRGTVTINKRRYKDVSDEVWELPLMAVDEDTTETVKETETETNTHLWKATDDPPHGSLPEDSSKTKTTTKGTRTDRELIPGSNVVPSSTQGVEPSSIFKSPRPHQIIDPSKTTGPSLSELDPNASLSKTLNNVSSEPAPFEFADFLATNNFFALLSGPHAIRFEDMLEWPVFKHKLDMHGCGLDPLFVWRVLKSFYFFA